MLRRTKEVARTVAESAGIMAPSLADASRAAEEHQRSLIAAQGAREADEVALQAAHDAGADDAEIVRLEAALAASKVAESRADARYRGAQKRLAKALAAETDKAKAAAIVQRDAALATFAESAAEIDRLAAEMARHAQTINDSYSVFAEAQRDGVAGAHTRPSGGVMAAFALERAIASEAGVWVGDKPAASDVAKQVSGAVLA